MSLDLPQFGAHVSARRACRARRCSGESCALLKADHLDTLELFLVHVFRAGNRKALRMSISPPPSRKLSPLSPKLTSIYAHHPLQLDLVQQYTSQLARTAGRCYCTLKGIFNATRPRPRLTCSMFGDAGLKICPIPPTNLRLYLLLPLGFTHAKALRQNALQ